MFHRCATFYQGLLPPPSAQKSKKVSLQVGSDRKQVVINHTIPSPTSAPLITHDSMVASYKNLSLFQYYTAPQLRRFYSVVFRNKNIK
jgi:hypothetical protein